MARIICTVTNDLSQDQRMIRICTSLQKAENEVILIGREKANSLPLADHSFQQKRLKCFFEKGKFFYLEYNLRLFLFLLTQKCDIINAIDLDTLLPCYLVSRLRSRICVYDAHEYFTEVPEVIRRPRIQKLWAMLAESIIPRLTYCYTVGPALARIFTDKYGAPFQVIRNVPIERKEKMPTAKQGKKIILYQGMLNEGRGLEVAIEAMTQLDNCELWLAGSGDVENQLKALSAHLKLENRIRFLGFVLPAELPKLTQQAWLGLNLLENKGLSYYYSLANKSFDYIQSGVPSIQMDFPEYRAMEETYGVFSLLEKLSADALVQKIKALIEQPALYQKLHHNCISAARQLNWEAEEKILIGFYQKITNE